MGQDTRIFINYRRKLSTSSANLLYLMLEQRFPSRVFMDLNLTGGDKWDKKIERELRAAKVVVALMPEDWLYYPSERSKVNGFRHLQYASQLHWDGYECFVRKELEIALEESKTIIPVLLDGAPVPPSDWLPETLAELPDFNYTALDFSHPDREAFRKFFDNIAKKAGLETAPTEEDENDLFFQPVNQRFPLPADILDQRPPTDSPYVGLKPFRDSEARLFFGRSREIFEWCHRITQASDTRLFLLDGYSGTGKSSLLQAGIIPRMRAQDGWGVAYGRREEDKINGLQGRLRRLAEALQAQNTEKGLLILDQVEEAVTNPIDIHPEELREMAEELAILLQQHHNWVFVLGFRSEYMARISRILEEVGVVYSKEHTLYPLDRQGIVEAVRSVSVVPDLREEVYPLYFLPASLPEQIAERLLQGQAGYHIAPLIQVNMELLWQKCRRNGRVQITSTAIKDFIDDRQALLDHYLGKIRENITEGFADDLTILELLAFYIEEKPAAATRLETEFAQHQKFGQDSRAQRLHQELERRYLLSTAGDGAERASRLAHDMLAEVIYDKYETLNTRVRQASQSRQFELLLKQLQEQLYGLEYTAAQSTLAELMSIGIRRAELKPYLLELLFFWNECGREEELKQSLQFWVDSDLLSEAARERVQQLAKAPERAAVRKWMKEYEGGKYQDLVADYLAPDDTRMVAVEGGSFTMGCASEKRDGDCHDDEKPAHEVTLDSFRMANIPVTFRQYGLYLYAAGKEEELEDRKPSWGIQADHPAVKVNWYDAVAYCNWLSAAMGLAPAYVIDKTVEDPNNQNERDNFKWRVKVKDTANGFRLPTEAEWEYAARGGRKSKGFKYAGSNDLEEVGWYDENSDNQTHSVAQKLPNELGLYDMSGNVREWCADHWHDNYNNAPNDGSAWLEGGSGRRVVRGGSWDFNTNVCRVAGRFGDFTDIRYLIVGFRLARD